MSGALTRHTSVFLDVGEAIVGRHFFLIVIPGRAKHEPGIHRAAKLVDEWIPGSREALPRTRNSLNRHSPVWRNAHVPHVE